MFRASRNMAGGRNETKRTLFIIDGAGSHKVVDDLFFVIDIAIIPAPCTDEIQLMDVVVDAKYEDSMYYQWVMWMMNGSRKAQPKSGNFVAADFQTILSWCTYAWKEVKRETILSGVNKCYMSADLGPEFDVEPAPEKMEVDKKGKKKRRRSLLSRANQQRRWRG